MSPCWGTSDTYTVLILFMFLAVCLHYYSSFYSLYIADSLNSLDLHVVKPGFLFAGAMMLCGATLYFLMPWASNHHSNHEIIQHAHFKSKIFSDQDAMFYGMDISSDMSTRAMNNFNYVFPEPNHVHHKKHNSVNLKDSNNVMYNKIKLYNNVRPSSLTFSALPEEDSTCEHWSEIEAAEPMSANDKVTDFLIQSQAMLQNYSQLQHVDMPDVRLEITNKYDSDIQNLNQSRGEIKDIKLEATICRNSPKRGIGDSNHKHKDSRKSNKDNGKHKKTFSIVELKDNKTSCEANYISFKDESSTDQGQVTTAV